MKAMIQNEFHEREKEEIYLHGFYKFFKGAVSNK